jgi:predicted metallopeptidase
MTTLNLTAELERLVADIVRQMEEFRHIAPQQVLLCVSSTRSGGVHGTYAKIHPLRFENGSRTAAIRRGRRVCRCEMPSIIRQEQEILYVIYFLVPRFLNLTLREKLITIFHELYHISPSFNGDLRRFPGRNYAHGSSLKAYNARMEKLVDIYLRLPGISKVVAFLDADMEMLRARHRAIVGRKMPAPRITVSRS